MNEQVIYCVLICASVMIVGGLLIALGIIPSMLSFGMTPLLIPNGWSADDVWHFMGWILAFIGTLLVGHCIVLRFGIWY